MAKGGARARSGPAPDPEALRRDRADDQAGWTVLPAAGRQGSAPEWPLTEASPREIVWWERLWKRPQALKWEQMKLDDQVALYVRSLVAAEVADAPTTARDLVRKEQESLGLSIGGLLRNRWRIAELPNGERAASAPVRAGLKVVRGGGDAA